MTSVTITLNDSQTARLQKFAEQHGQTLEQVIQTLIESALPVEQRALPATTYSSTLDLAGAIDDSAIAPLTARQIDEILADEARGQNNG
ncbi:MAG TPA: hypothetical protein VFX24_12970 [Ktedonobacterales bacterium]|jgi:hypothetical protein|nr:hypothetical protein [Ktedonobacterales bacterium]